MTDVLPNQKVDIMDTSASKPPPPIQQQQQEDEQTSPDASGDDTATKDVAMQDAAAAAAASAASPQAPSQPAADDTTKANDKAASSAPAENEEDQKPAAESKKTTLEKNDDNDAKNKKKQRRRSSTTSKSSAKKKSKKRGKKRKRKEARDSKSPHNKLFQDVIRVEIPLNYTADLAVAIQHTRKKRILAFREAYPELFPPQQQAAAASSDGAASETGDDKEEGGETTGEDTAAQDNSGKSDGGDAKAQRKSHVPDRSSYASILDYLEAKYVKGVMIDQDGPESASARGSSGKNKANDDEDDEEENGSVYSESSFLDDTDLKRDVAEQVLASRTTTKMELIDDSEFFVNVGNLEVEESEHTKEHYDPLKDVDKAAANNPKKAKPRKKLAPKAAPKAAPKKADSKETSGGATGSAANKSSKPPVKPAAAKRESSSSGSPPKKKAKMSPALPTTGKSDSKDAATEKPAAAAAAKKKKPPLSAQKKAERQKLLKAEAEKKAASDKSYVKVVAMIKGLTEEELPRNKTKMKLSIVCPAEKGPGDEVHFDNPNVPGQRLKVRIPKGVQSGGIFKVTIAIPNNADDDTDHNKWSREFYEVLSDYAYHYDQWMDAMTDRHKHAGTEFAGHFEKRKKFDKMIDVFPKDLKTPIDKAYLQKILRRARQNKHKRDKTAKRLEEQAKQAAATAGEPEKASHAAKIKTDPDAKQSSPKSKHGPKPDVAKSVAPPKPKRQIKLPLFSKTFPLQPWSADDFV